ncbi:MAG: NAD(P)-binding domain-containing protein [Chloroflexi bacterium]|nr:NAD(P)-binding domain-containing protein [Chloroflexota bacterium]
MSTDIRIAVLGGGHAAFAHAADLSLKGFEVRLFEVPEMAETIAAVKDRGGIDSEPAASTGLSHGFARIHLVTSDAEAALEGADILFIVVPAFAHEAFARRIAPFVKENQIVVLSPGNFGGSYLFSQWLVAEGCETLPLICEAQSMIYACRKSSDTAIKIFGIKEGLRVAVLPAKKTAGVISTLRQVFPTLEAAPNVLWTWLSNPNAIMHPTVTILNAGRLENTGGDFLFYVEGITPSVEKVIETLDNERLALGRPFGLELMSHADMIRTWYGHQGYQGQTFPDKDRNPIYYAIKTDPVLEGRYLTEDVPYGLVPWEDMGRLVGLNMPICTSLINLANGLLDRDFRESGQTLGRIGLGDLSIEALVRLVEEGE